MKEIFKIECMRAFGNKKFLLMALAGCLIALLDLVGTSWLGGAIDLAQCAEKIEPGYTNVFVKCSCDIFVLLDAKSWRCQQILLCL